jgi:uncharacterized glyoxalase superfamily protein PhnB
MYLFVNIGLDAKAPTNCETTELRAPWTWVVSVQLNDKAEAERILKGLSEGGQMQMAFQRTLRSPGFGMCIDKSEIPWMANCAPATSGRG